MAAGDTFRAAASDQLEIWAERTGCEIVVAESEKAKASSGILLLDLLFITFKFFNIFNWVIFVVVVNTEFCTHCITCSAFTGCKKGKRPRFRYCIM